MPILHTLYTESSSLIFWEIELNSEKLLSEYELPLIDYDIIDKTEGVKRKNERLAARLCAKERLKQEYHGINYFENGKPFLVNSKDHISISHSGSIVCAIFSKNEKVGVDIQPPSEKIRRIAKRVFNVTELKWANDDLDRLTELWCIKETAFKAAQIVGLSFREEIVIIPSDDLFNVTVIKDLQQIVFEVKIFKFGEYCVAYTL
tara:strand:+ start:159 stop:770 length:612 start_codon:yes stop_codon:yes gene_type:complete